MSKLFLILLLSICNSNILFSQLFISEYNGNELILGPEHVVGDQALVANYYLSKLQETKTQLIGTLDFEKGIIADLNSLERLKKKDKNKLWKSEKRVENIEYEISVVDSISYLWSEHLYFNESLVEAHNLMEAGECVKFTTDAGIIYSDELEIVFQENVDEVAIIESIPVEFVPASNQWVKKKADRNCLSADPNDCLVWCLVEVKRGYKYWDIYGNESSIEECPDGFVLNEENMICSKEMNLDAVAYDLMRIELVKKSDGKILFPLSWRAIECE